MGVTSRRDPGGTDEVRIEVDRAVAQMQVNSVIRLDGFLSRTRGIKIVARQMSSAPPLMEWLRLQDVDPSDAPDNSLIGVSLGGSGT
jgi:hypothetical protein